MDLSNIGVCPNLLKKFLFKTLLWILVILCETFEFYVPFLMSKFRDVLNIRSHLKASEIDIEVTDVRHKRLRGTRPAGQLNLTDGGIGGSDRLIDV